MNFRENWTESRLLANNTWTRAFPDRKDVKIRFHELRSYKMTALSNVGINQWHIKKMVGKKLSPDISTYLRGQNLKASFIKAMPQLQLTGYGTSPKYEKIEQALDVVMEVLRDLVKAKLQEKGLARKIELDWEEIYNKLLPEPLKREKMDFGAYPHFTNINLDSYFPKA